jgi:hypothetical protein
MSNIYITVNDFTPIGEDRFNKYIAENQPFDTLPVTLTWRMECLFSLEDALNRKGMATWTPAGKPTFDPGSDGLIIECHTLPDTFIEEPD